MTLAARLRLAWALLSGKMPGSSIEPGGGSGSGGAPGPGSILGGGSDFVSSAPPESTVGPPVGLEFSRAISSVPTTYAAIHRIARDCASVRLEIGKMRGEEFEPVPPTDPVRLLFDTVNPTEGRMNFWTRFWQSMLGTGEGPVLLDKAGGTKVLALWVLQSHRVDVKPGPGGIASHYIYSTSGAPVRYEYEDLYFGKFPDPLNEWRGLPPLKPAAVAAGLQLQAETHAAKFFAQGTRLAGVVETDEDLTPQQLDTFNAYLSRAWRTMTYGIVTLANKFKFKPVGESPKDADFIEMLKIAREEQLSAFGVPPALVGIFEYANYANSEQQERLYWLNTIRPLLTMLEQDLTEIVLPRMGVGYVARFAWAEIPAVQKMEWERAEKLQALVGIGVSIITQNRARQEIGEPPVPGGDTLYAPLSQVPVATESPAGATPTRRGRYAAKATGTRYLDTPERNAKRQQSIRSQQSYEKPTREEVERFFTQQKARILAAISSNEAKLYAALFTKATDDLDDIWNAERELQLTQEMMARIYTRIVGGRGQEALEEVGEAGNLLVDHPEIVQRLRAIAFDKGEKVDETTRQLVRDVLTDAVADGAGLDEIASRLSTVLDGNKVRSYAIARTETTSAYNFAQQEAWEASGVVEKNEWLTVLDDATRDSHADLDGETRAIGEDFLPGLSYPGDPGADAGEVVNCFLPGTSVSGSFVAGLKARYSGPALEIQTALGKRLSVTPNHPVLTSDGWKPAKDLHEGDELLSYGLDVRRGVERYIHDEKTDSAIEDVFESIASQTGSFLQVIGALDLHGDARHADKQIEIVGAEGELWNRPNAGGFQNRENVSLVSPCPEHSPLRCHGSPTLSLETISLPTPSNPGGLALTEDGGSVALESAPLGPLRVGPAAWLNASLQKPTTESRAADAEFFRALLLAGSGLIAVDRVVQSRQFDFTGHVYDLQSVSGWIVASGIVNSNCRCSLLPVIAPGRSYRVRKGLLADLRKTWKEGSPLTNGASSRKADA